MPPLLRLFQRHILAEMRVKAYNGGVVGILCQQVQVDLRLERVKGAAVRGADIRLISRQQEKIRGGKLCVVVGCLVVGDRQNGVACVPVCLHQLFRCETAVRKIGVTVQVCTVLLCMGSDVREHVFFLSQVQKGSRRGLPFCCLLYRITSLPPWSNPSSYISGK